MDIAFDPLRREAHYYDGESWKPAQVARGKDGSYLAQVDGQWQPFDPPQIGLSDILKDAVMNAPKSAMDIAKTAYQAVRHPADTMENLYRVGSGAIQSAMPPDPTAMYEDNRPAFNGVVDSIKDRYGSMEDIKRTVATDPVGIMADVASVAGGLGAGLKAARLPQAAGMVNKVATWADPMSLAAKPLTPFAERLYTSALKPSTTVPLDQRNALAAAGVQYGIPVSEAGMTKVQGLLDPLRNQRNGLVSAADANGVTVSVNKAAQAAEDLASAPSITPMRDASPALSVANEFRDAYNPVHPLGMDTGLPVGQAEALKEATYKKLAKSYMSTGDDATSDAAQKAIARSLKNQVADAVPGVNELNQQMSPLLGLNSQLERAIARSNNLNIVPLTGAMASAAGGGAGLLAGLLDRPWMKDRLGIALGQARDGNFFWTSIPGRAAPYAAGLLSGYSELER